MRWLIWPFWARVGVVPGGREGRCAAIEGFRGSVLWWSDAAMIAPGRAEALGLSWGGRGRGQAAGSSRIRVRAVILAMPASGEVKCPAVGVLGEPAGNAQQPAA